MLISGRCVWELRPLPGIVLNLLVGEAAVNKTGARWDELADDHVLFQTKKRICRGANGCARQHLDGVLE